VGTALSGVVAAALRTGSCDCRARGVMVGHVLGLVVGQRGLARFTPWQSGDRRVTPRGGNVWFPWPLRQ
jgi:hypothetical protein